MLGKHVRLSAPFFSKPRVKLIATAIIASLVVYVFGILTHLFEKDYYREFSYPLELELDEVLAALRSHKEPKVKPVNTFDYRFRIKNGEKCKNTRSGQYERIVILFVIKSALQNRERRDAIRRSWGWEKRFSDVLIRRIFVLGTPSDDSTIQDIIDEEYRKHSDVIQADFLDTYYNNTIKTMIGFKWVVQNCPKAQFIMFSDDDMYISTKNLLKFLRNPLNEDMDFRKPMYDQPQTDVLTLGGFDGRLLAGYVFFSSPMRHRTSKWYVSLSEYPFSKYPPYVTAGAYVMSYSALEDMYFTSMYTKMFRFDDVFLGIVAKKCNIRPMHNENFYFWKKSYDKNSYANVIASHGFHDPTELVHVWEEQRSMGHA